MIWLEILKHPYVQPEDNAEPQGKMIRDRRKAKKLACRIGADLIEGFVSQGNHADWSEYDMDVLEAALKELEDELDRRGEP